MIKLLQSGWMSALLGCILFSATMVVSWKSVPLPTASLRGEKAPKPTTVSLIDNASYAELDHLIAELQRERTALADREKELKEWELRLQAERAELNVITQQVEVVKSQIESGLLQVQTNQISNLKRQAKTYAAMAPEAAANLFKNLDDADVARIIAFMKEAEVARILEAFTRLGPAESKRAADIAERSRSVQLLPAPAQPAP